MGTNVPTLSIIPKMPKTKPPKEAQKKIPTNCKNCGAPLENGKCKYCGTEYR